MHDQVKFDFILDICEELSGVSRDKIICKSRKREWVTPRHMLTFFTKKNTDYSLKTIGAMTGNRDHASVIHSIKSHNDLSDSDIEYKDLADEIGKAIKDHIELIENRYHNIVSAAVGAFIKGELVLRESDKCFMGTYVYTLTGKRNTGWYQILVDGIDEEVNDEDIACFRAIPYTQNEKLILVKSFDSPGEEFYGLMEAAEAAYKMEDWSLIEKKVDLIEMIKELNPHNITGNA